MVLRFYNTYYQKELVQRWYGKHWCWPEVISNTSSRMIYVNYQNGKQIRGIVLALGGQWIRVAIPGSDDAVEFRQVRGRWVSEDCEVVTFRFVETGYDVDDPAEYPTVYSSEPEALPLGRIM